MSFGCLSLGTPTNKVGTACQAFNMKFNDNQFQVGDLLTSPGSLNSRIHFGRQTPSGRNVVIKKYNLEKHFADTGEDLSEYVQQEVASMKMLRNPHILTCIASFVVGQEIWVVTPLMGFGSVSNLISSHFNEGLPELACCFILRDVLYGLQYLHLQGVVHRSLRCSHILINHQGQAVLGGFRYCTKPHATGENQTNLYDYPLHCIKGNLCWMAPEILKQNLLGYNETSDIYSLGVSSCEMANGVVPYSDFPSTLMMVEKLRGSAPRLIDYSTLSAAQQQEDPQNIIPTTLADSGVGESVCSWQNKNSAFYNREFSEGFHNFVGECTISSGDERQSASQLLHHPFIKQLKKTSASLLTLLHPIAPSSGLQIHSQQDEEGGLVVEHLQNMKIGDSDLQNWDFD